jgi:hypothetical protein
MTDDLLRYADIQTEPNLLALAAPAPPPPAPKNAGRHRPNRGRKRRYIGPYLAEPPWDMLRTLGIPLPPTLTPLPHVPPMWRRGKWYEAWRRAVRERWGTVCHLCGHEGADSADHLVPLSVWGNQPYDPALSRMAHGIGGCPTCKLKCNSSRGNKAMAIHISQYKPVIEL